MAERQTWTPEQKEAALLALHDGATLGQVHADTGIPKGTLASWKRRQDQQQRDAMREELAGADPEGYAARTAAAEERARQTEAARARRRDLDEQDRLQMAARMRDEVHQLLDRINSPTVYKVVKTVGMGDGMQQVEVVEVDMELPNAADTKALVTSAAILVDKLQLLTGQATERHEQLTAEQLNLDEEWRSVAARIEQGKLDASKAADE